MSGTLPASGRARRAGTVDHVAFRASDDAMQRPQRISKALWPTTMIGNISARSCPRTGADPVRTGDRCAGHADREDGRRWYPGCSCRTGFASHRRTDSATPQFSMPGAARYLSRPALRPPLPYARRCGRQHIVLLHGSAPTRRRSCRCSQDDPRATLLGARGALSRGMPRWFRRIRPSLSTG